VVGRAMKILVIDDDEHVRLMVSKALQRGGYEVDTAADGRRGMDVVRRQRPGIVVTDIFMPEQEGIETILELRRDHPDIKILAMSGSGPIGGAGLLKMARQLGAHDAIAKPFRPQDLLVRVRALIGAGMEGAPA
jgi:DNA-binding response OmpR family regulator